MAGDVVDVRDWYDWSDSWTNYWDANPDMHGGAFLRLDGTDPFMSWEVVMTELFGEQLPEGMTPNRFTGHEEEGDPYVWAIQRIEVHDDEVFDDEHYRDDQYELTIEEGEPLAAFDSSFQRHAETLSSFDPSQARGIEGVIAMDIARQHTQYREPYVNFVAGDEDDYWHFLDQRYGIQRSDA